MTTVRRPIAMALWMLAIGTTVWAQDPAGRRLRLAHDTVVAGVHCAPTGRAYAVLHPDGALDECPLATDSVMAGHALPRGTWIRLREDGSLLGAWLPRDTPLQGLPCKGTGYKGWSVMFHPDGRLAVCFLSREATIDGVACKAGAFVTELTGTTQVALHVNGRLRECRVARDVTRNGVTIARGNRIRLSADGVALPPTR